MNGHAQPSSTIEADTLSIPHPVSNTPWIAVNEYIPSGFLLNNQGVFIEKKDLELISGPCWITALTRSQDSTDWGRVIHWIDQDGKKQTLSIPICRFSESGSPVAAELASRGLKVIPGKERALMAYLGSFDLPRTFRLQSVLNLGWLNDQDGNAQFMLPTGVIGIRQAEEVIFQPEQHSSTIKTMHSKGSLEHWQTFVAKPTAGNPYLTFGLCTAFAAPLMKFAELDSGGFHLYGKSSKGKTTTLQLAASVYGCGADPAASENSYINRWNTTGNALEATAAAHNDGILLLDEMGTCGARDFGKVIYDLFGGRGKNRLNKNSTLQNQRSWRILGLSTGEISVRQKIEEEPGGTAKTGQLIRMVDIPIHDGVISKTLIEEHGTFVNQLKKASGQYYGTAGPAFLEHLVRIEPDIQRLQQTIQNAISDWMVILTSNIELESSQQRVIQRLAVVATAGVLAIKFNILPLDKDDIYNTIMAIRDAWLHDDENMPEAVRGAKAVRDFILRHPSRFRNLIDEQTMIRDLAGYYDASQELYLFTDDGLKEAASGINLKGVIEELNQRGFLIRKEKSRSKSKFLIPGIGRPRLYAIHSGLLEADFRKKLNSAL